MYSLTFTVLLLISAVVPSLSAPLSFPQAHSSNGVRSPESDGLLARADDLFLNERQLRNDLHARQNEHPLRRLAKRELDSLIARDADTPSFNESEAIAASFFLSRDGADQLARRDPVESVAAGEPVGGHQAASFFLRRSNRDRLPRQLFGQGTEPESHVPVPKTTVQAASFFLKRKEVEHAARQQDTPVKNTDPSAFDPHQAASFFLKRKDLQHAARQPGETVHVAQGSVLGPSHQAGSFILNH